MPGRLALGEGSEHAHAVGAHHLVLDQKARHLLACRADQAAALAQGVREQPHVTREALSDGERAGAAFVGQHGHRDAPAFADLPDQMIARHAGVLEEHLAELALAGHLPQRSHGDAGRVELAEHERDAAVAIFRIGAAQHEDPVRPRAEGGPDLLPVQHEVVAVEDGAGLERRQVAAGTGLAEALAPDLVAGEHGRDEAAALRFAAVVDERRTEQPDAERVQDRRGVGARQLRLEDGLLDLRGAAAAPLGWPAHAQVARLIELALPVAAHRHERVLGGSGVAELFAPRPPDVGGEPAAQLVLEGQCLGRQIDIHGAR